MLASPAVGVLFPWNQCTNSQCRSMTMSLPNSRSWPFRASWCFWLSVFAVLILLSPSEATATFRFVNDLEPYGSLTGSGTKFRDVTISDRDTVTVFWAAGFPKGEATFSYLFCQRLSEQGQPISAAERISSDTLSSIVNWIHMGSNSMGKWVLVNHLVLAKALDRFDDLGLMVWTSDSVGRFAGVEHTVGNEVQSQANSRWGCAGVDDAGNYAVCWANNQEPDGSSVWCQLFDSGNSPRTPVVTVSDIHTRPDLELRDQRNVKAAMSPQGRLIVVWQAGCDSCPPVAWAPHVFFRLYGLDGRPLTGIRCASCDDSGNNKANVSGMYPDVAMQANGDFALVWRQYRYDCDIKIMLRRFNADGIDKGLPLVVDSNLCHFDATPNVASDSIGNLVVVWQDDEGDGRRLTDLKAKRYLPNGMQVGEEFKINDGDRNVLPFTTPVALNNNGLVGFLWGELRRSSEDGKTQQHDMMQLMDLRDVGVYLCGDANNDRIIDRRDAIFLITYVLGQGQSPASLDHSDLNCDGIVDLADIVRLVGCLAGGDIRQTLCPQ